MIFGWAFSHQNQSPSSGFGCSHLFGSLARGAELTAGSGALWSGLLYWRQIRRITHSFINTIIITFSSSHFQYSLSLSHTHTHTHTHHHHHHHHHYTNRESTKPRSVTILSVRVVCDVGQLALSGLTGTCGFDSFLSSSDWCPSYPLHWLNWLCIVHSETATVDKQPGGSTASSSTSPSRPAQPVQESYVRESYNLQSSLEVIMTTINAFIMGWIPLSMIHASKGR